MRRAWPPSPTRPTRPAAHRLAPLSPRARRRGPAGRPGAAQRQLLGPAAPAAGDAGDGLLMAMRLVPLAQRSADGPVRAAVCGRDAGRVGGAFDLHCRLRLARSRKPASVERRGLRPAVAAALARAAECRPVAGARFRLSRGGGDRRPGDDAVGAGQRGAAPEGATAPSSSPPTGGPRRSILRSQAEAAALVGAARRGPPERRRGARRPAAPAGGRADHGADPDRLGGVRRRPRRSAKCAALERPVGNSAPRGRPRPDKDRWAEAAGSMSLLSGDAASLAESHVGGGAAFEMRVAARHRSRSPSRCRPSPAADRAILLLAYPKAEALADARKLQLALGVMTLLGLLAGGVRDMEGGGAHHAAARSPRRSRRPPRVGRACAGPGARRKTNSRGSRPASTKWSARSPSASSASRSSRSTTC